MAHSLLRRCFLACQLAHTYLCCGLSEADSCLAVRSAGWRGKEMKQSCGGVKPNEAGGDGVPDDTNLRGGLHSYKEAW